MLQNTQWITEEIKEETKKYLETTENENMTIQNVRDIAETVLPWDVFSDKNLPQETKEKKKTNTNNQTLHLNQLEKEEQTKPKDSRNKELIKIRAEINELETKMKLK